MPAWAPGCGRVKLPGPGEGDCVCDAGAPSSICSHTSSARGKGGCAWSLAERLGPKRSPCRRNLSFCPRLEAAESHLDQVGAGCRGQRSWLPLVPFLSSSPFPLNPSPGPRRAWQPVPGLPSRGLQSRAQDGHGREQQKAWTVRPAHKCPGHRCSLLVHRCVCLCVHLCGCVQVCTVDVCCCVGMSMSARGHDCLLVCWVVSIHMCLLIFSLHTPALLWSLCIVVCMRVSVCFVHGCLWLALCGES